MQVLYMYFYLIYMYFTCTVYVNIMERKYYGNGPIFWPVRSIIFTFQNIYRASWGLGGEDGLRQESREKCTSRSRQGLCMPSDHLVQVPESQKAL